MLLVCWYQPGNMHMSPTMAVRRLSKTAVQAVSYDMRRQGVATALLGACEQTGPCHKHAVLKPRLPTAASAMHTGIASYSECLRIAGRRWRHKQIWLHVDCSNKAALALYTRLGYQIMATQRSWRVPFQKRHLMMKQLNLASLSAGLQDRDEDVGSAQARPGDRSSKTYIW
jgi:hypothetical protein